MRPPMMKRSVTQAENETAPSNPSPTESKREGYAEKIKLAQHLHDQGVNPLRWTEAHPAPQAAQRQFQETGRKTRDNQFDVDGRLYDWSPAVSATPQQTKAITEAYTVTPHDPPAARGTPVESIVDVDKVPLRHPFGTPHAQRAGSSDPGPSPNEERAALYRHYAKSGVDPDKAHLGDPLPMAEQQKLKAEIAKLLPGDKTEISGLPMFYQGFDDGWIYTANDATQESQDARKVRIEAAGRTVADGGSRPTANDNVAAVDDAVVQHYLERDKLALPPDERGEEIAHGASQIEHLDKGERDNGPAISNASPENSAIAELQSTTQSLPPIIAVVEKLQAGGSLTPTEKKIEERIATSLQRAGIKFDYTLSDPEQLREAYAQAQSALRNLSQGDDSGSAELAMAILTLEGTQALAGGNLDYVRMLQAGSTLEKLSIALQRYMPIARKIAVPLATELNIEAAKEGPIDYEAAFREFHDLFVGDDSASLAAGGASSDATELTNASSSGTASAGEKMDIGAFKGKLTTFDEVAIHFGDVVLIQHPHTTATDQIFIEELLDAASSMGCEPEPDPTEDQPDKKAIYGGNEAQRRITDISQPGHQGSAQPDVGVRLIGHGNRGEVLYNSGSTFADGIRFLGREIQSAYRTMAVQLKQLGASEQELSALANPVKAPGHLFMYRKQWGRKLDEIRQDLRTKIRKAFETYYEDCLPKGPPSIIDLDGIGD